MQNRLKIIFIITLLNAIFFSLAGANEQFNFDITEIEIIENGNKFIGKKRGIVTTNDGIEIIANEFNYDKTTNIIVLNGNVVVEDTLEKSIIYSESITYLKNQEIFFSNERSRVIDDGVIIDANSMKYNKILNEINAKGNVTVEDTIKKSIISSESITYLKNQEIFFSNERSRVIDDGVIIDANSMKYNKILNEINAKGNVTVEDTIENHILYSEDVTYLKDQEKIFTKGKTTIITDSKYDFKSSDVLLLRNKNELSSSEKSKIIENKKLYTFDNFKYFLDTELVKANNVEITTDYTVSKGESDIVRFDNGFFNLKENNFIAGDTTVILKKNSFDVTENDPRLYGVSSKSKNQFTTVNKGVFTSCKNIDGKCPPWSIKAKKIVHDKKKKQLTYDHAVMRVYDYPVMYFPKFFHPDPTVVRQAGFLQPQFNKSDILGSSLNIPYFIPISKDKDYTFKPTIFDSNIYMFQHEYREKRENSSFVADFSLTKGYKSSLENSNRNSISHFFAKYNLDLKLPNLMRSNLDVFVERTSNDTYLKIFENNLIETIVTPKDFDTLNSGAKLELDHDDYIFSTGFNIYESLGTHKSSDRYTYSLPYYRFSRTFDLDKFGWLDFVSNGDNNLTSTNTLLTQISNGFGFHTNEYVSDIGFKNNVGLYFSNQNTIAKKSTLYKSSPSSDILNIFEVNSSFPIQKIEENYLNIIEPKISLRYNPDDMKDYSSLNRKITADNVFNVGRLGLTEGYEEGQSLTVGASYKREKLSDINNYFEFKLATVFKDQDLRFIPKTSTLDTKNSNLFGSIEFNKEDKINLDYNFTLDNDFATFNYNSIGLTYQTDKLTHEIKFIEENGVVGNNNTILNEIEYNFDDKNYLSFKTRRNRTANLTEYYDIIYQYKNDCLTAGIKYKKVYYQDRDFLPREDLILTFTFYPLTTYEQEVDQNFYRGDNPFDDQLKSIFE